MIAKTPEPPYYAVIFSSVLNHTDDQYQKVANQMLDLASRQKGFLGFESARDELGLSVSYWASLEAIAQWKRNAEHLEAQRRGKNEWYQRYCIRIAKVEHEYGTGS